MDAQKGRRRERRGRGLRGPIIGRGSSSGGARKLPTTASARFDALVSRLVNALLADLEQRHPELPNTMGAVEFGIEEAPLIGFDDPWTPDNIPLGAIVAATRDDPARIVLFRKPIEGRAENRDVLAALALSVLVEQLAALTGLTPGEIDPRYRE